LGYWKHCLILTLYFGNRIVAATRILGVTRNNLR
jgi:hypothetical protein